MSTYVKLVNGMGALISKDGLYRYWLEREIAGGLKNSHCVFIMLNPSTANAEIDDPTIRRCKGFAERFQCGKLVVVNLFAFRATRPAALYKAADPVGKENDKHLMNALQLPGVIIGGWGAHKVFDRDKRLKEMAAWARVNICCLGKTADGSPRHPLYIKANAPLESL